MENWMILSKFIILVYSILFYTEGNYNNLALSILFILLYVSINMAFHILKNTRWKRLFIIVSIIFLIASYKYLNIIFILLLPLNICELTYLFTKPKWINIAIIGASAFLVNIKILKEYTLVSLFTCLIFYLLCETYEKIKKLADEGDALREKNDKLYVKLNKNKEYERQIKYMSQLEERNKLAQEIHDKVGHTIAGSLMELEAAKILIDSDRQKSMEIIQKVITVLREGMEDIRATLRSVKPQLVQIGINRVKLLIDETFKNSSIRSSLMYTGNLNLISNIQWKIIYENLNEALTNVLKYSKATGVWVSIEVLNKFVKIEVKDNGVGAYKVDKGIGLTGIEERTEYMGGKIVIDSSNGFSIITLLPVEGDKYGN